MPFFNGPVPDERTGILTTLSMQQDAFAAIAHGLTDEQIHLVPSASEISIAWLIHHATVVQENWLVGATSAPEPLTDEQNAVIMGRASEPAPEAKLDALLADLHDVNERVREAVRTLDLDTPMPAPDAPWFPEETWSVRWVWFHLIHELARHAGHGDIVRESIDGATMFGLVAAQEDIDDPVVEKWRPQDAS